MSAVVKTRTLSSWAEVVEAFDYLTAHAWLFRGHERADWTLQTTLEREFLQGRGFSERNILERFLRLAPRLLPGHLVPADHDVAAWLGLIQHYGGPTRLLDVTQSPFVALFFAFEPPGEIERAIWAIDTTLCQFASMRAIETAVRETGKIDDGLALDWLMNCQAQLVYSLVRDQVLPGSGLEAFKAFTGVFVLDPWKPDSRQSAQHSKFLCTADVDLGFMNNLNALTFDEYSTTVVWRFLLPAGLRPEVIERLWSMNVSAATLFPDLGGLARSLRTFWFDDPTGPILRRLGRANSDRRELSSGSGRGRAR